MTKQQAKFIAIIEKKMDETYTLLETAKIGSASEKDLRKTITDYQAMLSRVNPHAPNVIKNPQLGREAGFQSCI